MRKALLPWLGCGLMDFFGCVSERGITQEELVRRTQELANAVAVGDQTPWKKYFADDCMYFDEGGRKKNKEGVLNDVTPLPQGYSGNITVEKAQSHIENDIAILSYDMKERENVFGQELTVRYHATDTWMWRKGAWQIVAGQVFRYYADPPRGDIDSRTFTDYVGTYELAPGKTLTISREEGQLFRQRGDGPKVELIPEVTGIFFREGVEGRILFRRGKPGKVEALLDRRNSEDLVWKKVAGVSK
jgi:uncharacterized protein DUF4440/uncharacterized protein DUF3471